MNGLANSYQALGRHAEALKLHEETLALRQARLGPDHPDTLHSMNGLAYSYHALGRHAEALKLHEETLARRRPGWAPTTPTRSGACSAWPTATRPWAGMTRPSSSARRRWRCQGQAGPRPPRHAPQHERPGLQLPGPGPARRGPQALRGDAGAAQARLGPGHPDTLWSMLGLAFSYQALGRHDEAHKLFEETLALRRPGWAPTTPTHSRACTTWPGATTPWAGVTRPSSSTRRRWRCARPGWAPTTPTRSTA